MTYKIKIVPDFCCMETSERVLTTGVESFQVTAIKRAVFCYGDTIFHWSDVTEVKKIQQLPAFTENHSGKKKWKKTTQQREVQTLCQSQRHCAAWTGFLQSCRQEKVRKRSVSENKKKHVRPHEATLAFNTTIICRFNTPTRSHLTAINAACPSVYSDWQDNHFHASSADRTKGWNNFISYSSHGCSIWLGCVLCCSKRFHYDRLELQQFFTDKINVYYNSVKYQIIGLNPISNNNKCYRQTQKK